MTDPPESTPTPRTNLALWWHSEWGPQPLISLALPLMISAGFMAITLFTDRTLLYWQSELSAAAATGGGTLYWLLICFPMGLLGYISTFVSQYRGAKNFARIGVAYRHAWVLAWLLVPVFLLAIAIAGPFFRWAGHGPELAAMESAYLQVLLVGGIGFLFYCVQSGLLTGQGKTTTVLALDGLATIVNLVLDAVLIFGFGPIPAMGIVGAAIATSASFWIKVPLAGWIIARDPVSNHYLARNSTQVWERDMFRRLFVYGAPAGLQLLAEAGCFSVIMLQVGSLGEFQLAATSLALGINVLAFVPMIGLGIGVGVMVGQRLTEGRVDLARRTVACGLAMTSTYTALFAFALWIAPEAMVAIYAWGSHAERFERIQPLLQPLLRIIVFYCIFDGLQVVFVGAIKGAGDTWFVLIATAVISCTAVILGLISERLFGASLLLWWYVIASWVTTMGLVFALRFFSGRWEEKRVIERSTEH
ncbi:MAG: MATE family efflux transporter [Planctomycetales bacterium]|nr:MATE family efflux transporter [Planctomycetales bacterium]